MTSRSGTVRRRTRGASILGVAPPSTATATQRRQAELGAFLRERRGRVAPEAVGLSGGGRRRTPGLRREEVAQLAGVSVSWYTWLEQGRDMRPSPLVLDAIARVLRLSAAERAHVFHLARVELPLPGGDYPRAAPTDLAGFIAALDPHPAYLLGPRTDILAWNRASGIIGDFGALEPRERNLLRWLLLDRLPADPGYEGTARSTLARFRAAHARYVDDPYFAELIEELEERSPAFRAWWPRHDVLGAQSGVKEIVHERLGELRLHHLQTVPTSHPELRLTIYAPADERTRAALERFGTAA